MAHSVTTLFVNHEDRKMPTGMLELFQSQFGRIVSVFLPAFPSTRSPTPPRPFSLLVLYRRSRDLNGQFHFPV